MHPVVDHPDLDGPVPICALERRAGEEVEEEPRLRAEARHEDRRQAWAQRRSQVLDRVVKRGPQRRSERAAKKDAAKKDAAKKDAAKKDAAKKPE